MDFLELTLVFIKISIFARGAQMVRSDEALGSDDRFCHECFVIRISAKGGFAGCPECKGILSSLFER